MQCLNCSYENPEDAKFCQNCGRPIERACPSCGTANTVTAKFCKNCGHNLGQNQANAKGSQAMQTAVGSSAVGSPAVTEQARLARIASNTPASLAAKMQAASHLAGERRVVTALFADVVGSTSLAEQMDPEDWTEVMNRAFDLLTPSIYHYEGTIARLMGDALLAFFGAPVAHEDDPVRAVRAALDLISAASQYAEEVRSRYGVDFAVRAGMNTGPVVVGEVGSDLVYEYTAMGDAVNLAARMQSAARPMTALIAENTYRFIEPYFECEDLGTISVKGKAEPVHVFEVSGPKSLPGQARGLAGFESPLVGRDQELTQLLQLSAAVQAGLGRLAIIIGEAGLGKSRLVAEWKAHSPGKGSIQWCEGRCLSYGQGLAYHLMVDLLRSMIGVPAAASEMEMRAALVKTIEDTFGELILDIYPYLSHLLSLQLEGSYLERVQMLDPQALQTQYISALRRLIRALASKRPLVLVLEDIHWADPSSIELLIKLLPLASEAPVLFCAITRPDRDAPGWKLVAFARETAGASLTELNLNALSEEDSCQLVANLLEIEALPEKVRALILKKAEGNPFFVEEVIRMLIDRAAIVRVGNSWIAEKEIDKIDIPDNLQGLLLARIDRLPDDVKLTLKVASVIGRQFPVKVLEQVLSSEL